MQPGMLLNAASWHITLDWSEDEQRTLEEHLQRFPPDRYDALQRYIKLAAILPRKTVRDVALRCKWTIQQQLIRKRKLAEGAMGLAAKKPSIPGLGPGKSPLMPMPLPVSAMGTSIPGSMPPPFMPPGTQPATGAAGAAGPEPVGDSMIVDGPIAQLLESNYGILNKFRSNMAAFKVAENTQLLTSFRDNILTIIHQMEKMGGVMDQMPQLPVKLNVDLANSFLPTRSTLPTPPCTPAGSLPPQPAGNIPGMVPLSGFAPGSQSVGAQPGPGHVVAAGVPSSIAPPSFPAGPAASQPPQPPLAVMPAVMGGLPVVHSIPAPSTAPPAAALPLPMQPPALSADTAGVALQGAPGSLPFITAVPVSTPSPPPALKPDPEGGQPPPAPVQPPQGPGGAAQLPAGPAAAQPPPQQQQRLQQQGAGAQGEEGEGESKGGGDSHPNVAVKVEEDGGGNST